MATTAAGKKNAAIEAKAKRDLAERERTAALRRILEDSADLGRDQTSSYTEREVHALRLAFQNVMAGVSVSDYSKQAVQCDNVLWQLEKDVAACADAKTGDADREMVGADNWKFAKIPRRRRLQTLAITMVGFFTGMPMFLALAIFLTFNAVMWPFMAAYWIYIALGFGARFPVKKWQPFVRSVGWKWYRDYFPIRLVIPKSVRKQITPTRNYVFCYHPHGVASFGAVANFCTEANQIGTILPGITIHVQTLKINFLIPFWREMMLWAGMGDASAATIRKTLSRDHPGRSVLLVVGGAEESLLSSPKTNKLTLGKRKGFVKIALERGAALVPIYAFGETNVYGNWADGRPKVQRFLLKMQKVVGFAIPLIKGRGWFNYNFGLLPHRRQIITVVGEPLILPHIEKPSKEQVDEWHQKYCDALLQLYRENHLVYDVYVEQEASIVA